MNFSKGTKYRHIVCQKQKPKSSRSTSHEQMIILKMNFVPMETIVYFQSWTVTPTIDSFSSTRIGIRMRIDDVENSRLDQDSERGKPAHVNTHTHTKLLHTGVNKYTCSPGAIRHFASDQLQLIVACLWCDGADHPAVLTKNLGG